MVAAGKIGASDASREKHVTTKKKRVFGGIETEAPRAVTRNEKNAKRDLAEFRSRRFLDQEIGAHGFRFKIEAQVLVKFRIGHQWNAVFMEPDLAVRHSLYLGGVIEMVDVSMSDQEQVNSYPQFSHPLR